MTINVAYQCLIGLVFYIALFIWILYLYNEKEKRRYHRAQERSRKLLMELKFDDVIRGLERFHRRSAARKIFFKLIVNARNAYCEGNFEGAAVYFELLNLYKTAEHIRRNPYFH